MSEFCPQCSDIVDNVAGHSCRYPPGQQPVTPAAEAPEAWPEEKRVLIVVDFSAVAFACWATAEAAEKAGKKSLVEHLSICPTAPPLLQHYEVEPDLAVAAAVEHAKTCESAKLIKQYDAHEVLKTNLRMKMGTIEEHTGESPNLYVMALDTHAQWRFDLFPGYKGDREKKFNPRPEAEAFLREAYPGMKWVLSSGFEADDVIATLVKLNKVERPVVVVSGDKDLWQLMEPKVKLFNSITKKFLDLEKVAKDFHGLGPQHIRLAKAFWGDPSDSLPNCAPRQQKQLVPLIKAAEGDISRLGDLKGKVSEVCWKHLADNKAQVVVNWKLAGLNSDVPLEWK